MRALPLVALVALVTPAAAAESPEARDLVKRWTEAQNSGALETYDALYAKRFTGVRRSGTRVFRFDRAGWLKDRARMFKKPMVVEVEGLSVTGAAREIEVRFTQKFAQGTYRDSGTKHMILVREDGALKIVREELLDSTIPANPQRGKGDFAGFVIDGKLVLDGDADASWAKGRPTLIKGDGTYAVSLATDPRRAPPNPENGRALELIDALGNTCETRRGALELWRAVTPHFGTVQEWNETHRSDADIAKQLRDDAGADGFSRVAALGGPCDSGLIARKKGATAPIALVSDLPPGELREVALAQTRKLPAYAALNAALKKEEPKTFGERNRRWHTDIDVKITTFAPSVRGQKEQWVSVLISHVEGCADWSGELWALYRVTRAGSAPQLSLVNDPGTGPVQPTLAVDLDGDGWPELLYQRAASDAFDLQTGIVWSNGGRYDQRDELRVPYHDCPC